jgi:hypothetical protein
VRSLVAAGRSDTRFGPELATVEQTFLRHLSAEMERSVVPGPTNRVICYLRAHVKLVETGGWYSTSRRTHLLGVSWNRSRTRLLRPSSAGVRVYPFDEAVCALEGVALLGRDRCEGLFGGVFTVSTGS